MNNIISPSHTDPHAEAGRGHWPYCGEMRCEACGGVMYCDVHEEATRAALDALRAWRAADRDFPVTLDFEKHNAAATIYQSKLAALRAAADTLVGLTPPPR